MGVAEIDTVNAVLAIRLELQDQVAALPEVPSHEEIAQTRDRISTLLFQLEELVTFDAEQSNVRVQRSIYRAMLSDFPEVDRLLTQGTHSTGGDENQRLDQPSGNSNLRVVGRDGYYEDPRINPDGSTSLEAYMHDLDADEVHPPEECYICMQQIPYSQLIAHEECEHVWCRPCLSESFESALKNETHYPVRCCRSLPSISHESPVIVRLLGEETIAKLNLKIKEYETADRTYCYEPTCSTFIDPDTYINGMATCRSCGRDTCVVCKAEFHPVSECREPQDEAFDNWKRENEASTCPGCHRVILISHGCNHMRCHCGTEFCYQCNARWKTCQCSQWREDRLLERAEVIAVRQGRAAEVQRIAERIAEECRREAHEECRHNHWTRRRIDTLDDDYCSDCGWEADVFLWECDRCDKVVCGRCKELYAH